jgi:hypothetical protein
VSPALASAGEAEPSGVVESLDPVASAGAVDPSLAPAAEASGAGVALLLLLLQAAAEAPAAQIPTRRSGEIRVIVMSQPPKKEMARPADAQR